MKALVRNGTGTMDSDTLSNVSPLSGSGPGSGDTAYSEGLVYDRDANARYPQLRFPRLEEKLVPQVGGL